MTTAIAEYNATEAALADLRQRYKDVVFDVSTTKGMETARKSRAELVKLRTSLEAKRKQVKEDVLDRGRLIDAEAKRINTEIVALEQPIDALIKAEEQRKAAEKAEKERIERERIEGIHARIAYLGSSAVALVGKPLADIESAIKATEETAIDDSFAEFAEQAKAVKDAALTAMGEMRAAAIADEQEKARLQAEREELARLRAEQEQRDREAKAKAEAEQRQRDEEERQRRTKIEADERAARERIEAQEREARLKREEEDRIAREKREAEEREARKRQAEEDARLKAERDRIEAERRDVEARERKAREEAEAKERAERDAREAAEREERRQQTELMDGIQMLQTFVERHGKRKEFATIGKSIAAFLAKRQPTVADGLAALRSGDSDAALRIADQLGPDDAITIQNEVGKMRKAQMAGSAA